MKLPQMTKVESSNLKAIGFNHDGLFVQFQNGGTYNFPNAPEKLFHDGLKAKSPGAWFRDHVKDKHKHQKI